MFYSHQLLARKAPMGQIWMAATLHTKINRKKLDKLDIIQICEEILNPSVPMALRLSGILMGGVVIVYERKVKLLLDDVTRLRVEINGAWRPKPIQDPTLLPKGKTHARKEAVTLPENEEADFGDVEQTRNIPKFPNFMEFQQSYISMQLDEPNVNDNPEKEDLGQQFHQADTDNITLFEYHGPYQTNTETYDRFERKTRKYSEGKWAHVKSGEYKGDLAKVVAVSDRQGEAVIKLIPRIDILGLTQKDHGIQHRDVVLPKDGYLYKKVSLDSLSFCGVIPSEKDMLQFALYNLVSFSQKDFGLIVGVDEKDFGLIVGVGEKGDCYKVLKEGSDGPAVVTVGKKEVLDGPFDSKFTALDLNNKQISVSDVVKISKGPSEYQGKQGVVRQIYRGVLFLYDESEQENGGYFCCKSQSCEKVELLAEEPTDKTGGSSSRGKQYVYGSGSYSFSQIGGSSSLGKQCGFGCASHSVKVVAVGCGGGASRGHNPVSVELIEHERDQVYYTLRNDPDLYSFCFEQLDSDICWLVAMTRQLEGMYRKAGLLPRGCHFSMLELKRLTRLTPDAVAESGAIMNLRAACDALVTYGTVLEAEGPLHFNSTGSRVLGSTARYPVDNIQRFKIASYEIYDLDDFLSYYPNDGADRFEKKMMKCLKKYGPFTAWLTMCSEYYRGIVGKDVYLPSKRAERLNWVNGHLLLSSGYGVNASGQAFFEYQDSYGATWADEGFLRVALGRRLIKWFVVFKL